LQQVTRSLWLERREILEITFIIFNNLLFYKVFDGPF